MEWADEHVVYLQELRETTKSLAQKFKIVHDRYRSKQMKIRIPTIVISTITGISSFGVSTYPPTAQMYVPIVVGCLNVFVAIISSIESFLKINEIIVSSLNASLLFMKLSEKIGMELRVPETERETSGINTVRNSFIEYDKIMSESTVTVLKNLRWIKPFSSGNAANAAHAAHAAHAADAADAADASIRIVVNDDPTPSSQSLSPSPYSVI